MSRTPSWLARALLALAGVAIALGAGELAVRLLSLEPPPMWRFDDAVGWTYRLGLRTWYTSPEFRSWVEINSRGLHDREHPFEKPPGVYRVVTLGDSYTAALEVPLDESWPRRLERLLQARIPGATVEVVNLGVGGYATANELLLFRRLGARYRPDLVLLALEDSDIRDNDDRLVENFVPGGPYFAFVGGRLQPRRHPDSPLTTLERALGQLRLVRLGHRIAVSLARDTSAASSASGHDAATPGSMSALYRVPRPAEWSRALTITAALIGELDREVRAAGGRLVAVSLLPLHGKRLREVLERGDPDPASPERALAAAFAARGIPSLWPARALHDDERRTGESARFARDRHFTSHGHLVVAGLVADFLGERGLLPRAGEGGQTREDRAW
jgi:hypothetical protein